MPRENKNRGRREEKKLKRKAEAGEDVQNKRQRADENPNELVEKLASDPNIQNGGANEDVHMGGFEAPEVTERPFYGMLEDEEQEYFRRADELLELNDFPSAEERSFFLANVFKEADGKELKIACSQSCSRLMERLILLSTVDQKKKLFLKFRDNFAHLVQHRFASHCCEMLFIKSAEIVTRELTGDIKTGKNEEEEEEEKLESMETLFLLALDELEGNMMALMTDRFASHTLRVLLVILSGRPLERSSTRLLLQSKRKERTSITNHENELSLQKRAVPESFSFAINKITSDTIATMDQSFIKILATHESGNPTLQLLLELDITSKTKKEDGQKSILTTLLPDDITEEKSESSIFINGLMYEPVGSRLLETIVTFVPGKTFKQIYRAHFKDRIAGLARNEISSYVVAKVLTRLSREDLEDAITAILPQITGLIERNRTVIVKILIERCHAREAPTARLTEAISTAFGSDPNNLILKMACISDFPALTATIFPPPPKQQEDGTTAPPPQLPKPAPAQLHGSLLAQSMLAIPEVPTKLIQTSLLAQTPATLHTLSLFTPTSHILQAALLPTPKNLTFRRKLIATLLTPSLPAPEPILALANSNIGTHILDSLLLSAPTLFMFAERIGSALLAAENKLRDSFTGRIIWRNWSMDLYKRRPSEWVTLLKTPTVPSASVAPAASSIPEPKAEFSTAPISAAEARKTKLARKKMKAQPQTASKPADEGKSAIQLARERFAEKKAMQERMKNSKGTGANGIAA